MSSAREIALWTGVGGVGGALFLYAFPGGSISTLMHAVLRLPGPGVGIALIMGPFVLLIVLSASLVSRARGRALAAALGFALVCSVMVRLLAIPTNPKGAIGSASFVGAIALSGLAVEALMPPGRSVPQTARFLLTGAVANLVLVLFYWVVIFPRTAEWVQWRDVPLLSALCLCAGVLSGLASRLLCKPLLGTCPVENKE